MHLDGPEYAIAALAAMVAGAVNALAGGGTLITFPTLLAIGAPAVVANVTNTVALCPGFLGAIVAQIRVLKGQGQRLALFLPAGVLGGILGGVLLLRTGERLFRELVPFLIFLASLLLALQEPVKGWLVARAQGSARKRISDRGAILPIMLAAVYGGYFGAGLSVIILATLGWFVEDNLTRLNALKQTISFSANLAAALLFVLSAPVNWGIALAMAVGAVLGGALGGRIAGHIRPTTLRWVVVSIGLALSVVYWLR